MLDGIFGPFEHEGCVGGAVHMSCFFAMSATALPALELGTYSYLLCAMACIFKFFRLTLLTLIGTRGCALLCPGENVAHTAEPPPPPL